VVCILAQGDDSLLNFREGLLRDGNLIYIENDFSAFDQSQKEIPNKCELNGLRATGCPQPILELLYTMARLSCRMRMRSGQNSYTLKFVPEGPGRITGGPNTTFSNTHINILMLILAYFGDFTDQRWLDIGVKAKMKRSYCIEDVTFLRGTWIPLKNPTTIPNPNDFWICSHCGAAWWFRSVECPRCGTRRNCRTIDQTKAWIIHPSSLLKRGKVASMTTKRERMLEMAYGLGAGMGEVPLDYPILGPFRRKLMELGHESDYVDDHRKIMSDFSEELDCEFIREWIITRYGVTGAQIDEVEDLINAVPSLPWVIGHPLFALLANDYL
jgi:hypothetical protein